MSRIKFIVFLVFFRCFRFRILIARIEMIFRILSISLFVNLVVTMFYF